MALPSMLVNTNAFLKNTSFVGLANTASLPKVVTKTVDMVLAGYSGDMERDIGKLEKLESEITISDFSPTVLDLIGSRDSKNETLTLKGAVDADGTIKEYSVKMQGFWKSVEFNEWKPETEVTTKFAIAVEVFTVEIDGAEIIHIDKGNNIYRVNGVDRNEAIRNALGQ